ncbi:MAG TPA: SDR family NAD(P)-dependent oxidoreductase [Solirubrobacteraceae bacterium]|jgi:short-subunit dehydrogenase|nr:SDR family NAD(P)-dependent oxidoreductase [Solirubrobacteraceae bacterium]
MVALAGSTALVTGATGGIGDAIARALRARGVRLLVSGRREAKLTRLAEDLGASAIVCDLSVAEEVDRLASAALEAGVDVLVANAALPATGLLSELTQPQIDRMLDVNLRAPIALARVLAPAMVARGRGHLVFVSSISGKVASPASSMYNATKFGLRGFAFGLREDLRGTEVGVSVVAPGFIREAGMFAKTAVRLPPGVGTRSPQDVAAAVVRAIERNRAELDVAPLGLRAGAAFGSVAPGLAGWVSDKLGSARIAEQMAETQRDER